nr:replication protein C, IncQ-type [uncultured Rhodoferax sp.]
MTNTSKHQSELIKLDPAHVSAPGLFRSLNRKARERAHSKLYVVYSPQAEVDGQLLEFHGPEPLGTDDLRVLQGLLALATLNSKELTNARLEYMEGGTAPVMPEHVVVKCSFSQLARTIGYASPSSGATHLTIRECIERMAKVSIFFRASHHGRSVRLDPLIDHYESDLKSNGVNVGLNKLMTAAIFAGRKGEKYLKMRMDEVRLLKSDHARLIHHRLHYLNEGASIRIGFERLAEYVWPESGSPKVDSKRLGLVKKALNELLTLGWSWQLEGEASVRIFRPRNSLKVREDMSKARSVSSKKVLMLGTDVSYL